MWYTMTISKKHTNYREYVFALTPSGELSDIDVVGITGSYDNSIRPAISLVTGLELASNSGDGTKDNPYRVVEN